VRILFVNNDPTVLAGLKGALRRYREQWRMAFLKGPAAVKALQSEPIDVVVAEIDVEGPLGGSLLEMVAEEHPSTIRVVLSASANVRDVMRVVPHAHQYVSMPVEPPQLVQRIERADALRTLMREDRVRALGALNQLPTHHRIVDELRVALQDPDIRIETVADIIERDPAMAAKILQLVNSAFFSRTRQVTHVRDAVGYLGLNIIESLVVHIGLVTSFEQINGVSMQRFQLHGLQVGKVARRIAPSHRSEVCFTAGLVHDVGKLVLSLAFGSRYAEVQAASDQGLEPAWKLEQAELGVTHPEAGAYLLGVWGLPLEVVEGVAWHHHPCEVQRTDMDTVAAVHLADAIVHGHHASKKLVKQLQLRQQLIRWRRRYDREAA